MQNHEARSVAIFCSSVEKHNLRYLNYKGDGDTNLFLKVFEAKPYEEALIPISLECVGHVQKRMGTRLRKLRNDYKGKKLGDNKPISGKGRLTDVLINKMQNYYGIAIRQNISLLHAMKKSVLAVFDVDMLGWYNSKS